VSDTWRPERSDTRPDTRPDSARERWDDQGVTGSIHRHIGIWVVAFVVILGTGTILLAVAVNSMSKTERAVGGLSTSVPALLVRVENVATKVDEISVIVPRQQLIEGRLADMRTLLQEVDGRLRVLEEQAREERAERAARLRRESVQ
jgi:hypothetical protein